MFMVLFLFTMMFVQVFGFIFCHCFTPVITRHYCCCFAANKGTASAKLKLPLASLKPLSVEELEQVRFFFS